jgi:hypothetical protein
MTKKGAITRHIASFPEILRSRMQGHENFLELLSVAHKTFSEEGPGDKLPDMTFATKSIAISSFSIRSPRLQYANPFA